MIIASVTLNAWQVGAITGFSVLLTDIIMAAFARAFGLKDKSLDRDGSERTNCGGDDRADDFGNCESSIVAEPFPDSPPKTVIADPRLFGLDGLAPLPSKAETIQIKLIVIINGKQIVTDKARVIRAKGLFGESWIITPDGDVLCLDATEHVEGHGIHADNSTTSAGKDAK